MTETEIRIDERKKCIRQVEAYAARHASENRSAGDAAKAQAWVILQAAADLRNMPKPATQPTTPAADQ